MLWRTGLGGTGDSLEIFGKLGSQWWRVFTAAFAYDNTGYAFLALAAIGLFGWLLERRHGPLVVIGLFLLGGVGGLAATAAVYPVPFALGARVRALALLFAWALPDLLALRAREDVRRRSARGGRDRRRAPAAAAGCPARPGSSDGVGVAAGAAHRAAAGPHRALSRPQSGPPLANGDRPGLAGDETPDDRAGDAPGGIGADGHEQAA